MSSAADTIRGEIEDLIGTHSRLLSVVPPLERSDYDLEDYLYSVWAVVAEAQGALNKELAKAEAKALAENEKRHGTKTTTEGGTGALPRGAGGSELAVSGQGLEDGSELRGARPG